MVFRFCYNQQNDIYSFEYSAINNSLDGSEHDQFRGCEDIEEKWNYYNWNDDEIY